MTAWGYDRDPMLLALPQFTIELPHISMAGRMAKLEPRRTRPGLGTPNNCPALRAHAEAPVARTLVEFRPGVFARWMDDVHVCYIIWRFDGQRWRARNLADTGYCGGPDAAPISEDDRRLGDSLPPPWLMSTSELSCG